MEKISKVEVITEPDCFFSDMILVEFVSGSALSELKKVLSYTFSCEDSKVTYEICDLSNISSELEGKVRTHIYLKDLRNLAQMTGQDYAEVLSQVMSLLGQSVTELSLTPPVKLPPDPSDRAPSSPPPAAPSSQMSSTTAYGPQAATGEQEVKDEVPQSNPNSRTSPLPDLNPPKVQCYVVEHIMKSDDGAAHLSTVRLRSFSGRTPRPQHETDFETWRSSVDLLLQDPAVSDLQRSRRIVENLFSPAAGMVKHLKPETLPKTYLQILDSAYGTVQDGDELYAKFMEIFQDAGEKPSAYLQRLQVALVLALKRGGVKANDMDRHLLNQFCRGCWDDNLISELQLKQRKSDPPPFSDLLLLLRTEEDREAAKAQRMKQHLGSKARAGVHAQYAYPSTSEESKVDALTRITQQLTKQLADIQKQLTALTQPATHKSAPLNKANKPVRTPNRPSSAGPKPGYCYNCGEDGHIKTHCDNEPNPT
ncbi:zinc finger CCHC domain-containing protein 18, partial [Oryzias melastigma]|uniref:zinc finger CCHC domain-containing protein 18 n=1 Tax=Oryzias melastigma TaxID=30732 RepID=UPI000CF8020A